MMAQDGGAINGQTDLPEGLEKFMNWLKALEEASENPKSPLASLSKFWMRLRDQILNDQNNPPDGWAKVWQRLRAIDEDKIKDYMEDIDSLLILVRYLRDWIDRALTCISTGWSVFRGGHGIPHRFLHCIAA